MKKTHISLSFHIHVWKRSEIVIRKISKKKIIINRSEIIRLENEVIVFEIVFEIVQPYQRLCKMYHHSHFPYAFSNATCISHYLSN
jgi:hypothetical protein